MSCDSLSQHLTDSLLDARTIDTWRSETLTALASSRYIQDKQLTFKRVLTENIFHHLKENLVPAVGKLSRGLETLYESVVVPAVDLVLKVQLSLVRYEFHPAISDTYFPTNATIFADILTELTLIDVKTRKTLKATSPVFWADNGTIGKKLLLLEPALSRRGGKESKDDQLRKAVYLIQLDRPLGKRGRENAEASHQTSSDTKPRGLTGQEDCILLN